jgi:monoamine oxidase
MRKSRTPLMQILQKCLNQAILMNQSKSVYQVDSNRRKFLKRSVVAGTVMSLSGWSTLSSCGNSKIPRIAIIGGGIAGLNCAYQLKKKDVSATIYEADKRTGGRMFSKVGIFADGMSTEFGAEFIDTDHEDMLSLVDEFGLEMIDTHMETLPRDTFFIDGKHYTEEDVVTAYKPAALKILEDRGLCGTNYDTNFAFELDAQSIDVYIRSLNIPEWLKKLLDRAYLAEFGLECREQSALNFISLIGVEDNGKFEVFGESDERFKVVGGNQRIVDEIASRLEGQIQTNHYLSDIKFKGKVYQLTFKNNQVVEADIVVLALPFSILRQINIDIPNFPEEKMRCIQELGYGQNNKIMLSMTGRPWREGRLPASGYLVHNNIYNGWDNGHMQGNNEGKTGYTIFLGGPASEGMAAIVKQTDVTNKIPSSYAEQYAKTLETVFPGFESAFGGDNHAAMWTNNPYVQGSYSCFKVGQWQSIMPYIASPVGNLYFAGEHCSADYSGYMNGAAETGRLTAESILSVLG